MYLSANPHRSKRSQNVPNDRSVQSQRKQNGKSPGDDRFRSHSTGCLLHRPSFSALCPSVVQSCSSVLALHRRRVEHPFFMTPSPSRPPRWGWSLRAGPGRPEAFRTFHGHRARSHFALSQTKATTSTTISTQGRNRELENQAEDSKPAGKVRVRRNHRYQQ